MNSRHPAPHPSLLAGIEANPGSISSERAFRPGHSLAYGRLLIFPDEEPEGSDRMRRQDRERLLSLLTARDVAILTALFEYRYLDAYQVQQLFFQGLRSCQQRIRWLRDQHLAHQWRALHPPGYRRRHSVLLLSLRGAGVLAACRGENAHALVRRARRAREDCLQLTHDLETNGFFVAIAAASRPLGDQGLYHWVGAESCQRTYRERGADLVPDGWGRYLTAAGGEVVFFLEWDRATEGPQRLGKKVSAYRRHFEGRANADRHHVLFAAPGPAREEAIRRVIEQGSRRSGVTGCRFSTTNLDCLHAVGILGPAWLGCTSNEDGRRMCLAELPPQSRSLRRVEDCIGKPGWWERRPGGGEGA